MEHENKELLFGNKIDINGFIVETVVVNKKDIPSDVITFPIMKGIYRKPKWTGNEWIEGETEEERTEREELEKIIDLLPSAEEIADSELEIKVLTLLIEMEVV